MSNSTRFDEEIGGAFRHFQQLEETLKDYLATVQELADAAAQPLARFRKGREQFEGKTLGSLVNEFSYHVDDLNLVARLKQVVENRNIVAHKAHLHIQQAMSPAPGSEIGRVVNWAAEVHQLEKRDGVHHDGVSRGLQRVPNREKDSVAFRSSAQSAAGCFQVVGQAVYEDLAPYGGFCAGGDGVVGGGGLGWPVFGSVIGGSTCPCDGTIREKSAWSSTDVIVLTTRSAISSVCPCMI